MQMADSRTAALGLRHAVDTLGLPPNVRTPSQLSKLAVTLRNQDGFFGSLSQADVEIVSKWLSYEYFSPGRPVYQSGQFGDSMYIVIGGACEMLPLSGPISGKDVLLPGQAFGELALVAPRKPRTRTILAGPAGAHLATLHRSAIGNMRFLGAAQTDAGRALQAVLAACCIGVLRVPPGCRTSEEVDNLTEFLSNMETFKKLPADMVRRLASDCAHLRLPTGRVIFEEDAPGNCMYIVVSGQCQVRARPLAQRAQMAARTHRPAPLGIGMALSPRRASSGRQVHDSTPRSLTSFASTVLAAMSAERAKGEKEREGKAAEGELSEGQQLPPASLAEEKAGDGGAAESGASTGDKSKEASQALANAGRGAQQPTGAEGGGRRSSVGVPGASTCPVPPTTTAPGPASYHGRRRPGGRAKGPRPATAAALGSRGSLTSSPSRSGAATGSNSPMDGADSDAGEEGVEDQRGEESQAAPQGPVNRDSPFWIARYMDDALKRLHLSDSSAGLGLDMTPLAAVAAARWRQVANTRPAAAPAAEGGVGAGDEGDGDDDDNDGAAAAEAAAAAVLAEGDPNSQEVMEALLGRAAARALRQAMLDERGRAGQGHDGGAYEYRPPSSLSGGEVLAAAGQVLVPDVASVSMAIGEPDGAIEATPRSTSPDVEQGLTDDLSYSPTIRRPLRMASMSDTASVYGGVVGTATSVRLSFSTAPAVAVEDPAKRLLSQLGNRDPANVSRALLTELVQRADLGVVLYEVAKRLVRRGGGPKRINPTTSRKINKALQLQIRAGQDRLPGMVQGQRVLGKHATVNVSRNGDGAGSHSVVTDGASVAASTNGGGPPAGNPGSPGAGVGVGMTSGRGARDAGSVADSVAWGETSSAQPSLYNSRHRMSYNGANAGTASMTRPGSALTSAVSAIMDNDNTEYGDDDTEYDWVGSDLYSMASYKQSLSAVSQTGSGARRLTAHELDHNNLLSVDLSATSELEASYGPIIRTVTPGQSFGELALLHRESRRTATVITAPAGPGPQPLSLTAIQGSDQPVDLICITRHTYNYTVRAAQVTQLQGLLAFLGGLAPFRLLDEQQRASLAVFCRQREVSPGAVLAMQGEPARTLWMIQEGEVVFVDNSVSLTDPLISAPPLQLLERAGGPLRAPPQQAASQPAAAGAAGRSDGVISGTSTRVSASGTTTTPGGSGGPRALRKQISAPDPGSSRRASVPSGPSSLTAPGGSVGGGRSAGATNTAAVVAAAIQRTANRTVAQPAPPGGLRKETSSYRRVNFVSGTANHGGSAADADEQLRQVSPGVLAGISGALTSMGPGGIFGEGLLGSAAALLQQLSLLKAEDEETGRVIKKSRSRNQPIIIPSPYPCTVIARRPTRLLTITANDLSRFADFVAMPLEQLSATRSDFLAARAASVVAAKEVVTERASNARRVLRNLRATLEAGIPVGANPYLVAELHTEEANAAAAVAAAAAAEEAAADAAAAAAAAAARVPVLPTPLNTPQSGGGGGGSRASTSSDSRAGGSGVAGISMQSVMGRRTAAQLLPGALLKRISDPRNGIATVKAVAAALRASGNALSQPPHPAAGRLLAVLSEDTPQLPESSTGDRTANLSPSESSSASFTSQTTTTPPPRDAPAWPPYFGYGLGSMRCLSTIAEESSTGLLRTTGSAVEFMMTSAPLGTPGSALSLGMAGAGGSSAQAASSASSSRVSSVHSGSGGAFDISTTAEAADAAIDPRVALEAFSSGSSSEEDLLAAAEELQEEDEELKLGGRAAGMDQLLSALPDIDEGLEEEEDVKEDEGQQEVQENESDYVSQFQVAASATASRPLQPLSVSSARDRAPPVARRYSETGPGSTRLPTRSMRRSSPSGAYSVLPPLAIPTSPAAAAAIAAAANANRPGTAELLPPLLRPPRQRATPYSPLLPPYTPPSPIESISQDSFRSYHGISRSASIGHGGIPTTAGSGIGMGSLPCTPPPYYSDDPVLFQRMDSAGSRSGSGESMVVYTDDGTASPDLTNVRYEPAGAKSRGAGGTGAAALELDGLPYVTSRRRSASSSLSEGLTPLSGFTSRATSAYGSARTSATAAAGIPFWASGAAAVPSAPLYGMYGEGGGGGAGYEAAGEVVMEAVGASLDRLVGGRPRPLSRGDSSLVGGSSRRSSHGGYGFGWQPGLGTSQRIPTENGDSFDGYSDGFGHVSFDVLIERKEAEGAGEAEVASSERQSAPGQEPGAFGSPAACGASSAGSGGGASLASESQGRRSPHRTSVQLQPPTPQQQVKQQEQRQRQQAPHMQRTLHDSGPPPLPEQQDELLSAFVTVAPAAAREPALPWSHRDGKGVVPAPLYGALPPYRPAAPALVTAPQAQAAPPQTSPGAAAPETPAMEEPPPLPVLPPLALMALRRQLVTDEDDVLGNGPQSCSPRAAMTDSPLRSMRPSYSRTDSPVHSPRIVSQVY